MLGQAMRCVRGIEVTEDSVSLEPVRAACIGGPGHYLGSEQTLGLMRTEYVYPALGNRASPREWDENGRPDLIESASARKKKILSEPSPAEFPPAIEDAIRAHFNIHLSPTWNQLHPG